MAKATRFSSSKHAVSVKTVESDEESVEAALTKLSDRVATAVTYGVVFALGMTALILFLRRIVYDEQLHLPTMAAQLVDRLALPHGGQESRAVSLFSSDSASKGGSVDQVLVGAVLGFFIGAVYTLRT